MSSKVETLQSKVESLQKLIDSLQATIKDKDMLISIYENRIQTLEKLSKVSSPAEQLSMTGVSMTGGLPVRKVSKPNINQQVKELEDMDVGALGYLLASHPGTIKSYRDNMEKKGIKFKYNPNPFGRKLSGEEVEFKSTKKRDFKEA